MNAEHLNYLQSLFSEPIEGEQTGEVWEFTAPGHKRRDGAMLNLSFGSGGKEMRCTIYYPYREMDKLQAKLNDFLSGQE